MEKTTNKAGKTSDSATGFLLRKERVGLKRMKRLMKNKKHLAASIAAVWLIMLGTGFCGPATKSVPAYEKWEAVGRLAATKALEMIKNAGVVPSIGKLIVLTNAGFTEANGEATLGTLDGFAAVTGASRGRNTLIEIHSAAWWPLWFALYDKDSGFCAYLEVDPSVTAKMTREKAKIPAGLFRVAATERIDAGYLYKHSAEYKAKFENKVFGGNEFRIITIANAIAAGAPPDAVRAFEFHDHFCPGVTSGILMARYLKAHFPPGQSGYFVNSVEPWCKEDARKML
jgi:formylmethanofuran dehydrogenase subunit E-like metal-binding protein